MKKYLLFIFIMFLSVSCFEEDVVDEKKCDLECEKTEFCAFYIGEPTCVDIELNSSWHDLTSNWQNSCAVNSALNDDEKTTATLRCWGDYRPSKSDDKQDLLPTINNNMPWSKVSNGYGFRCGISNGKLYCWGENYNYQFGLRDKEDMVYYDSPQQIGADEDWKDVSVGSHVCAIKTDGSLYCWGKTELRDMGFGDDTGVPALIDDSIKEISFSNVRNVCSIKENGELYCWGENFYGVLGNGDKDLKDVPTLIGSDWKKIVTASGKSCGIKTDGSLYCWGRGSNCLVFGNDKDDKLVPTMVGKSTNWEKIFLSETYGCAINTDSELYCWGDNSVGVLGLGDRKNRTTPTKVGDDWSEIAGGVSHLCGIKTDGSLYCWGTNAYGELGLGMIDEVQENTHVRDTPQRVIILKR